MKISTNSRRQRRSGDGYERVRVRGRPGIFSRPFPKIGYGAPLIPLVCILCCTYDACIPFGGMVEGFEHHVGAKHTAYLCYRGGDLSTQQEEDENRKLDEYIEKLVASVDSSEIDETQVGEEEEVEGDETLTQEEDSEIEENDTEVVVDGDEKELETETPDSSSIERDTMEEESQPTSLDSISIKEIDIEGQTPSETVVEAKPGTVGDSKPKRKRASKSKGKKREKMETSGSALSQSQKAGTSTETASAPPEKKVEKEQQQSDVSTLRRPNALYRFLLGQGRVGHVIVMLCVLIVEWVQTFLPMLQKIVSGLALKIFGSPERYSLLDEEVDDGISGGVQSKVNAQYGAFVSTDGSTVRGKQRKKLVKQADLVAVEQLRRVGSVREAKYRHLSVNFMKRHGIGPYGKDKDIVSADDSAMVVAEPEPTQKEEEESDVDWVVEAFMPETAEADRSASESSRTKTSVKPSVSLGVGSSGTSVGIGVEVEFGGPKIKKKRKKSRKSVLEIVAEEHEESFSRKKKKASGPRASDRDGGGGLVGRLRSAVGSNIPSSLLGAYPGDAVPPDEAASADGIMSLATKYGYGEWSDDDDVYGYSIPVSTHRRKKRVVTKKRRSTKRRSSSDFDAVFGGMSLSDVGASDKSSFASTVTTSRNVSPRSRSTMETLIRTQDSSRRQEIVEAENQVRLPMERINEIRRKQELKASQDD